MKKILQNEIKEYYNEFLLGKRNLIIAKFFISKLQVGDKFIDYDLQNYTLRENKILEIQHNDDKITYFVNYSGPKEGGKNMIDRNWLFEQKEIKYDSSGNFSETVTTGTSTQNPYFG